MKGWLILLTLLGVLLPSIATAAPVQYPDYSALPPGDYLAKCKECKLDGDRLRCMCPWKRVKKKTKHLPQTLDMDLCTTWAAKLAHNKLACDNLYQEDIPFEPKNIPPNLPLLETNESLPGGDYRYFCQQCDETEDGELECSCKIDGWIFSEWFDVSLPLKSCKNANAINYSRGYLFCNSEEMFDFLGSFAKTCSECVLDGTDLNCLCRKTRCGWSNQDKSKKRHKVRTTLADFRSCAKEIINCNGNLRCGSCATDDFWDEVWRPHEGRSATKSCDGIWY